MDLNLLKVFVAVYEAGTATGAAERLFVTQSAVSQSLTRLRHTLGDQLFVRHGQTLRPTGAAEKLYPAFHAALLQVESAVAELTDFDPVTAKHRFRIALSELGEVGFLPVLLALLRKEAPGVTVDVIPLDVAALPRWLARGTVDLAISSTPPAGEFDGFVLKTERYVLLMSASHPLAARQVVSRNELMRAQHLLTSSDSAAPGVSADLQDVGIRLTPALVVSHTSALPGLLHTGPWVTIVPESLAESWEPTWPLVTRPLPVEIPPILVRLYSRSGGHESSALTWFRDLAIRAATSAPRRFWSPVPPTE